MRVEIRIYRRHDADLIMLKSYGVNISKMMRLALDNYVEGERIKFSLPGSHPCDITNCSMLRYRLNITNPKVIDLLKSIKRGYRNQFCKALLRDMMDSIALGVYLADDKSVEFENDRIKTEALLANTDLGLIKNRKDLSTNNIYKQLERIDEEKEASVVNNNEEEMQRDERIISEPTENTQKYSERDRNEKLFSMFEEMLV